jgi:NAD(P)-dependent dehydrogenase (short-subunit alcohol dehydrogenase family)
MELVGKVGVVTGGAGGIGQALARSLLREGAKAVVIADLDESRLAEVAADIGCDWKRCDVTDEAQVQALVAHAEAAHGPIDLFCSNAGVLDVDADFSDATSAPNSGWERSWAVNVMAHVYAARACLPSMRERRTGHFLHTISAAGLLSQIGSGPYSTTKHAAIGFAEHLAIAHKDDGIGVSMLCPQGVDTAMIRRDTKGAPHPALADGVLSPEVVADIALAGVKAGQFLILPHAEVATYMTNKSENYARWIGGMAKMRRGRPA